MPPAAWNALAGDNPCLRHAFLKALQDTGCVGHGSGWEPQFLTLWDAGALAGAMPLYAKLHSYGEDVFDWAWADAYQRHGYRYYPKLVNTIPFTPTTGQRVLAASPQLRRRLVEEALKLTAETRASSLHCLFPCHPEALEMQHCGMLLRSGVQFHWQNNGYADFDAFLAVMSHDKRKKIKQERRRLRETGVRFERLTGEAIDDSHWRFLFDCYCNTYRQHHSTPYLNLDFFRSLGNSMPHNLLLVLAWRKSRPLAVAFFLHNAHTLYGRYWGAREALPGLHFETCFYQAIEFCIERGITLFEAGAQGEHKLARGFLPTPTWSAHWLAHPEFARAVEEFLARESRGVSRYISELSEHAPFRSGTRS
ncbi:MAG: GNAT family N-acetyltransferase [Burkholderiales bacterium]